MRDIGSAAQLFTRYSELVLANGHETARTWPYAFDTFDNGVRIPPVARRLYHRLGLDRARFGNPFSTQSPICFLNWLNEPADGSEHSGIIISRLWKEIYSLRPDLQAAFPDVFGTHRQAFFHWIMNGGQKEQQIDECFMPRPSENIAPRSSRKMILSFAPSLYIHFVRPLETTIKPVLKRTIGRNESLWIRLKQTHYRLTYAYHLTAQANIPSITPQHADENKPFGVNLAGYFRSEKGVGEAGRASARALEAAAIRYVLNDVIDSGSFNTDSVPGKVSDENPYSVNLIHVNADQVPIFAAHKGDSYFRGRYNIGCWFWELSYFPKEWYPSFGFFDELWAPTSFIQDALSRVSPVPIVRMPLALSPELELVQGISRGDFGLPEGHFLFLSIIDFASFMERKNPLGLIEAFKIAFREKENAALILKVAHSKQYPAESEALMRACGKSNIRILDRMFSRQELNTLLSFCDCYVSLHRSEGFGIPIAEAMTLGKPVIVTGYSGNMDFTTLSNSFLVKFKLTEISRDYGPYRKGWVWAEPDIEHAAELMRYVYQNPIRAGKVGQRAKEDVMQFFHPHVVAKKIRDRLQRIAGTANAPASIQSRPAV
jgi:glycosyltransferase involved in cell wall biosynthesis